MNQLADELLSARIQGHHGKRAMQQDIFIFGLLALFRGLGDLQRYLHAAPTCCVSHLAAVLEITNLGKRIADGDPIASCSDSCNSITSMLVSDYSRKRVEVHEDSAKSDVRQPL